jgi:hypothetical protein
MTTTLIRLRGALTAVLAFLFALGAVQAEAQDKSLTLVMPPCPINAVTVPPTKTALAIPSADPLGAALDVAGTIQITDQTASTVSLTHVTFGMTPTGINSARTVNTLAHATGSVTFDKGCTATDPYGSNNCHWDYAQSVTMGVQGALQEDVTSGHIIVNLTLNNTIPFQFNCPVCGVSCTITIPSQVDQPDFWNLFFSIHPFPAFLIHVPSPPAAPTISKAFTPSTIATHSASTLSFTLTNPNPDIALSGAGFTDSLPAGVIVSTPNALTGSCGGGTITATAGGSSVSLTGATLDPGASCTFSIGVTSSDVGNYVNTTGPVTANESFTGSTATASLNATAVKVPTLTNWGLLLFCILIISWSFLMLRRR